MSRIQILDRSGRLRRIDDSSLSDLRRDLRGEILLPGDAEYDAARTIWNGMIQRRPALIVRCGDASDVSLAVRFARAGDFVFSVRSGGHNIAGTSLCDDGLVIDLSRLGKVEVDPVAGVVRVEAGCTLGDVDRATQPHGLAVPTGIVSETGIAGLTVGGGFGWLTRKHGLTSDNLLAAEVVLADGTPVVTSADEYSDLFWGIRGGGGNFGIVTKFTFQAHALGPQVVAGMVLWPFDQAQEVMEFYRDFSRTLPDRAGSLLVLRPAPPAPFLSPEVHGKLVVGIAGMHAGPIEEGERVFAPITDVGTPLGGAFVPKLFTAHQTMLDAGQPKGRHYYWKSEYVRELTADTDRILRSHARTIESPHTAILCFQLGGVMARVPEDASAAGHRGAGFVVNVAGAWDDPSDGVRHVGWVRRCWEEIRPYSTGTYVNFLNEDDAVRVQAAYGPNYDRLAQLKAQYDPENVLHANQNIAPRLRAEMVR